MVKKKANTNCRNFYKISQLTPLRHQGGFEVSPISTKQRLSGISQLFWEGHNLRAPRSKYTNDRLHYFWGNGRSQIRDGKTTIFLSGQPPTGFFVGGEGRYFYASAGSAPAFLWFYVYGIRYERWPDFQEKAIADLKK